MAFTHRELLRRLPGALPGYDVQYAGSRITARAGARRVVLTLAPERRRSAGSLTLPVTGVELELTGFTRPQADRFLAVFERTFHRGGG